MKVQLGALESRNLFLPKIFIDVTGDVIVGSTRRLYDVDL
jgi:hypothetical protein